MDNRNRLRDFPRRPGFFINYRQSSYMMKLQGLIITARSLFGGRRLTFCFVIGGLESESERIFHVDPIRGGQNQACSTSAGIGCPIHGQPSDGEVGC